MRKSSHGSASPASSRRVLVLIGPTASGKTPISLRIARQLGAEILSADSRQLYKLMDIGTAKPTSRERGNIKHYFIDDRMPDEDFNAGMFGKQGRGIIDDILWRKKVPLVVGGSGLYIQALVEGLFDGPSADDEFQRYIWQRMEDEGPEKLLAELIAIDPQSAKGMLPSNKKRIVRALEVYHLTGIPLSEMQKQSRISISFTPVFVGLNWDRAVLYDRINRRVDTMIEGGLVGEVKSLLAKGYSRKTNALQTVGYREVFDFLDGKVTEKRMIELIKQNSRRYAKRQLTWFRHDERIKWFDVNGEEDFQSVAKEIITYLDGISG
jgi:tRNA dimethylallyltransferase